MLKAEVEMVQALARIIAKEEVALAEPKTNTKKLEADIKAASKASADALALAVKILDAKIKKLTPVEATPVFKKK